MENNGNENDYCGINGHVDVTDHSSNVSSVKTYNYNPSPGKRVNDVSVEVAQNSAEVTENGYPDVSVEHSVDTHCHSNSMDLSFQFVEFGKRANDVPVEVAQNSSEITENGFPDVTVLASNFDNDEKNCNNTLEENISTIVHEKNNQDALPANRESVALPESLDKVLKEKCNESAVTNEHSNSQVVEYTELEIQNDQENNISEINNFDRPSEKEIGYGLSENNFNQHTNQSEVEEFEVLSIETPILESIKNDDNVSVDKDIFLKTEIIPDAFSLVQENISLEQSQNNDSYNENLNGNSGIKNLEKQFDAEVIKSVETAFFETDPEKEYNVLYNSSITEKTDIISFHSSSTDKDVLLHPLITEKEENFKHSSISDKKDVILLHSTTPEKEDNIQLHSSTSEKETILFHSSVVKNEGSIQLHPSISEKEGISLHLTKAEKVGSIQLHPSKADDSDILLHSTTAEIEGSAELCSSMAEKEDSTSLNSSVTEKEDNVSLHSLANKESPDDEWLDILGNGLLKKKVLKKGLGYKTRPVNGELVTIRCEGKLSDGTIVDKHDALKFILSDEEVIQAFDLAVALMQNGEVACISTDARYAYGIYGRPSFIPPIPQNASITYEVEILSVKSGPDISQLTTEERISYANAKRERGNELYMIGDHSSSINAYKRGLKYVEDGSERSVFEMKVKLLNNLSAAQLKVKAYAMAIISLDSVLRVEPRNTKALFRKGKCLEGLGNDEEALKCLKEASALDPQNKLILQDIAKVRSRVAVTQKKEKEIYEKMFSQKKKEKVTQSEPSVWPYVIGSTVVAVIGVISGIIWFRKHS